MTEWLTSPGLTPYPDALAFMEERVRRIREEGAGDLVWLLEHPPLYTAGTGAKPSDLLSRDLPVFEAGRGGQYTYHGPGQRVAYAMIDLHRRNDDLRAYVRDLEEWIIRALALLGVKGGRDEGGVGVWVGRDKIAAIGVRVRKWVAWHGVSVNLCPDLSHYNGIIPCGIRGRGVTSLEKLGVKAGMQALDDALKTAFEEVF